MQRLTFGYLLIGALGAFGCDDGAAGAPDAQTPDAQPDARPDAAPRPVAFCDGPTAQRYDPFDSTELEVFPDDLLTRPDPDSPTGLRLDLSRAAWLEQMPSLLAETFAEAATLHHQPLRQRRPLRAAAARAASGGRPRRPGHLGGPGHAAADRPAPCADAGLDVG